MYYIEKFIDKLNIIYNNISIYRSIIIVKYIKDVYILINLLKKLDYEPLYIDNFKIDKNYRLYILLFDNINIIDYIDKNDYNLVIFMI